MAVVTMRQLLESGVHFGHQTRRWNPKMKRFIFTERNGIYIIDLRQTLDYIEKAYEFVRNTVAEGGSILFVGTKKQAQEAIAEQATRVGQPYVNHRWLGGMLTNFQTVYKRLQRMKELEALGDLTGTAAGYTKKETLQLSREKIKLTKTLGGLRDMQKLPAAVWIVDTKKEHIAVDEARKLGIPVIAVLDTNCDPDEVDFPIPGNDDAIRSAELLTKVVAAAVADGLIARSGRRRGGDEKPEPGTSPPTSRWPSGSASCSREPKKADEQAAPPSRPPPPPSAGAPPSSRRPPPRVTAPSRPAVARTAGADRAPLRTGPTSTQSDTEERVMSNFTAADVKKLRDLTGAGMMDCKKALTEAEGDFDKAVEILRVKGAKDVGKRAGRTAANGLIAHSGKALLELNCETDFVAKNDAFIELAQQLVEHGVRRRGQRRGAARQRARRQDRRRPGPGAVRQDRREAGAQPLRQARRHRRGLPAPQEPGPAAGGRRAGRSTPARPTRPATPTPAAWPCRSPRCGRSTSPATRCRPRSSSPSGASPSRPPARRTSPRRPCRRSSRVG